MNNINTSKIKEILSDKINKIAENIFESGLLETARDTLTYIKEIGKNVLESNLSVYEKIKVLSYLAYYSGKLTSTINEYILLIKEVFYETTSELFRKINDLYQNSNQPVDFIKILKEVDSSFSGKLEKSSTNFEKLLERIEEERERNSFYIY